MLTCDQLMSHVRLRRIQSCLKNVQHYIHVNISDNPNPERRVADGHICIWRAYNTAEWMFILEDDAILDDLSVDIPLDSKINLITLYTDGIKHKVNYNAEYDMIMPDDNDMKNHGLCGYYIRSSYAKILADSYDYKQPIDHYVYQQADHDQLVSRKRTIKHHKYGWSMKSQRFTK